MIPEILSGEMDFDILANQTGIQAPTIPGAGQSYNFFELVL